LARKIYIEITDSLLLIGPTEVVEVPIKNNSGEIVGQKEVTISNGTYSDLLVNQDKLFKQCRSTAIDLGLTITSRCKLVMPKKEEKPPETDAEKRFGGRE